MGEVCNMGNRVHQCRDCTRTQLEPDMIQEGHDWFCKPCHREASKRGQEYLAKYGAKNPPVL